MWLAWTVVDCPSTIAQCFDSDTSRRADASDVPTFFSELSTQQFCIPPLHCFRTIPLLYCRFCKVRFSQSLTECVCHDSSICS